MPNCKVGDLVVVIKSDDDENFKLLGMLGTIIDRDLNRCRCNACMIKYAGIPLWYVHLPGSSKIIPRMVKDRVTNVPDTCLQPIRPSSSATHSIDSINDLDEYLKKLKVFT
jgi:hypothetical protein